MANPETFARRIRGIAEAVPANAAEILRKAVRRAGSNVVKATPVDTGLARSNWLASIGAADLSARSPRSQIATIQEINSTVADVPADSEVHIANGGGKVPYLERLNSGSSFQAPANFVRIAAMAARDGLLEGVQILKRRRNP